MQKYIRFPWIQSNDPVAIHFSNVLPWMNHSAVPSCWAVWARLWFRDGSGGDSQLRISFCKWWPLRYEVQSVWTILHLVRGLAHVLSYLYGLSFLESWLVSAFSLMEINYISSIPRACHMSSIDVVPSIRTVWAIRSRQSERCVPPMTIFRLLTRPCTTWSVSVPVMRASSRVSRSSLWSTSSISLSPNSFFANFSKTRSETGQI